MAKVAKTIDGSRVLVLWRVWNAGGNAVVTIPAALARFAGKDEEGFAWVEVTEALMPLAFSIRVLTSAELDNLEFGEEV